MLTKTDIAAIRTADAICVHLDRANGGRVRLIKRKPYNAKPFETDQEYVLESAKVTIDSTRGRNAIESGSAQCFAMESIYPDQRCPASSIMKTLRAGDEVTFCFSPDDHTNQYVAAAGLHGDVVYLNVRRGGKQHSSFELSASICPSNSARMCRGVPDSDSYARDAATARALA